MIRTLFRGMLVASLLTVFTSGDSSAQSISVSASVKAGTNEVKVFGNASWATGYTAEVSVNVAPADGGVITPTSIQTTPANPPPPAGTTGVIFGTAQNPVSAGTYKNGEYWVWGVLKLSVGSGSPTFVYSQWTKVTINDPNNNATKPPVPAATATISANSRAKSQLSASISTSVAPGWAINGNLQLYVVPQSSAGPPPVIGPGVVATGSGAPDAQGAAQVSVSGLPTGTYVAIGVVVVSSGGTDQLVLAPPTTGVNVP